MHSSDILSYISILFASVVFLASYYCTVCERIPLKCLWRKVIGPITTSATIQTRKLLIMGVVLSSLSKKIDANVLNIYNTTESGLRYSDIKVGDGPNPAPGEIIRVHYTGWLDRIDGKKKFDSSYDRNSPLVFKFGVRRVIAGWDEGIINLRVGGKRNLIIPPELGYGSEGAGDVIPPFAVLYFTIELVGIGKKEV